MTTANRSRSGVIGVYLLWIVLTFLVLIPIYWLFLVASRSPVELFGRPTLAFTGFWPNNFQKLLGDSIFRGYLWNSWWPFWRCAPPMHFPAGSYRAPIIFSFGPSPTAWGRLRLFSCPSIYCGQSISKLMGSPLTWPGCAFISSGCNCLIAPWG